MNRRVVVVVLAVLVVAAGETVLVTRVHDAHRRVDANRSDVAEAARSAEALGTQIPRAQAALAQADHDVGVRNGEAERAGEQLAAETAKLARANRSLANANATVAATAASLVTLDTCVTVTQRATVERNAYNPAAAINMFKLVQPLCASLVNPNDREAAVFPFDFSDPSVLRVGNRYYAYSTNSAIGDLPVISSTDLVHWTIVGNALPFLPAWAAHGATWAPAVTALADKFVAYYTVRHATGGVQCISVAVAEDPGGPFIDLSKGPLVCQTNLGGSIDPQPFVDAQGRPWLLWKSEGASTRPATIWSQPLRADGLALTGTPSPLIQADQAWEGGVVEGPSLVDARGALTLFYSGNNWNSDRYALGAARCSSPAGPCYKPHFGPVFATHGAVVGPGSATAFASPQGDLWLAYNAYSLGHVGYPASRLLHIARLEVDRDTVSVSAR